MPAVINEGQGNVSVPVPNRGAVISTGGNPYTQPQPQAQPVPSPSPSPSPNLSRPVFNRALIAQQALQEEEASPVSLPPATTTSGYVASQGPAQYALKNPLSATTLLGGFELLGQDIQNFFAGSATGYSHLAQSAASNPNPLVRANLAPLFYGLAGFVQSFGTLTGKYGAVPVNPETVVGFGIGLGAQALVGGGAYDVAKGALFGGTEITEAGIGVVATKGLLTSGGLGRVGSIAFGAGFWGSFSAGLSALQGAKPTQIAESGLIGAGLGAGGEFLGQFLIPKIASKGSPLIADHYNVSFLRTTGAEGSLEEGTKWISTGYGDVFYTAKGKFTYVPKNIAPYTGSSIVPKFPDILPEGIVPIEEGGGGDIGPSPFVKPETGINRIFPEGTSKNLDFNDLVGKFPHPETSPSETGRVVSNPNPDISQDVIEQIRSRNAPPEIRTKEGYSLLQTEPPLKGYEQGYTMLTVNPEAEIGEEGIDLAGARASSLGIGGAAARNLFKIPKAFQPTLGGKQSIPSHSIPRGRGRSSIYIPNVTPDITPDVVPTTTPKLIPTITPDLIPTITPITTPIPVLVPTSTTKVVPITNPSLDLQEQVSEIQQEIGNLSSRPSFPPLFGLMSPTAKPSRGRGRKRYGEGQRKHHLSENIVTGEGLFSIEEFLR